VKDISLWRTAALAGGLAGVEAAALGWQRYGSDVSPVVRQWLMVND
jgi:hypothetical protein